MNEYNASEVAPPPMISIKVDEAQDDRNFGASGDQSWRPWSSPTSYQLVNNLQSTSAPLQSLYVYHLASLIPPLLAAILEHVDIIPRPDSRLDMLYRFYRLLNIIVSEKADAYLDILEVVAYHTTKARHSAVSLLVTFWPHAVGHLVVSKPLPIINYSEFLRIGLKSRSRRDHPYAHQFVPWRFITHSGRPALEGMSKHECRSCSTAIHGFGLLCPLCMCAVHFDCYDYPEGSLLSQYELASDPDIQKVAMHRFCYVLQARRDSEPRVIIKQDHAFRLVNLFTLSLCFVCHKPLWGCVMQGLKCTECMQFAHSDCISDASSTDIPRCSSSVTNSKHIIIDWTILRRSFADYYKDILLPQEELDKRTYEEVSVFYSALWMQLRLMDNGVALGSIVIKQKRSKMADSEHTRVDEFELQYLVRLYEVYLSSSRLPSSLATDEYLQENRAKLSEHSIMFDWSNLVYISTAIKSPYDVLKPSLSTSSDLLNVSQSGGPTEQNSEHTQPPPFEVVSLSHMRDVLGYEFHLFSDAAARLMLSHLHHLGFFGRLDFEPILFQEATSHEETYCTFPLPLGLDLSTSVETLVAAVEACLSDIDLSVNEVGFLLLMRKLWPNGLASEYALRRLVRNVLSWILSEVFCYSPLYLVRGLK